MRHTILMLTVTTLVGFTGPAAAQTKAPDRTLLQAQPRTTQPIQRVQVQRARDQPEPSLSRTGDVPYVMPERKITARRHTTRTMARSADLHDLPLWADDLAPGRRNYVGKAIHSSSGSQKWGYDIGQMRYDSGAEAWSEVKSSTDWKNPKNSDFYTYGQPVYAMGPGKVIRCWRNAPENPRPFSSALGDAFNEPFEDQDWLHPQWRAKRMSGGGNHLLVEEADGDWILYAHAQPGTIPSSLCPHDQTLYSAPNMNGEADVPEAQQAIIQAGQFLFKIGNSGNSSAPHLHVHQQDEDSKPVQLRFRRGLSTKVSGNQADIDAWTSFRGQPIPSGPVLVWPPRRLAGEYARHGFPAGDYQRMFTHLADSGFWLEWIDGYSVGGKPYLNFVWRPAKGAWRAYHLVSPQTYQARFDEAVKAGYSPFQVESSLVGGKVRYSVIFRKGLPGKWIARHGLSTAQHDQILNEATAAGMRPVNSSVVSVGGQRFYTDLYRAWDSGTWLLKSQVEEKDYQGLYHQNAQAGRRPVYVNQYMHGGKPFISVIFAQKPTGPRKDRHGMSAAKYQQEFDGALQAGLLTRAVSSFDGAQSQHRFIAVWRK